PGAGRFVRVHRAARTVACDAHPGPVPALCDSRARDPVRPAIRHQHGGESASNARQGHDAAVHLLWGIVNDLAGLGHGNAARADARASADREPPASNLAGSGRRLGLMTNTAGPVVLLAAGGTGGHLFPAEALAAALKRRGMIVDLATDARGGRYGSKFPARQV